MTRSVRHDRKMALRPKAISINSVEQERPENHFMRNLLIHMALVFFAFGAIGLASPASKVSQLPDGTLSGKTYSNDALGLKAEIPDGWIATAAPKGPVNLDYRKPNEPANQCSKVLLSLSPAQQAEGRFNSMVTIFAIDPHCFSGAKFPQSMDKQKIVKFADKIVKSFSHTPFISYKGADIDAFRQSGLLIIHLSGDEIINAVEGRDPAVQEPLHVNISFSLAETNGYWVAWAVLADDPSKEELKKWNVQFKIP